MITPVWEYKSIYILEENNPKDTLSFEILSGGSRVSELSLKRRSVIICSTLLLVIIFGKIGISMKGSVT